MRAWAAKHGRPPTSHPDWLCGDIDHPSASTVVKGIGWNECLRRAGLPVTHVSHTAQHISNDDLAELYASGLSCREIAERYDAGTENNVNQRLRRMGVKLRTRSEARRLWADRRVAA